ncbi:hypothetical protein HN011_004547, partial [Eciton burchellii]
MESFVSSKEPCNRGQQYQRLLARIACPPSELDGAKRVPRDRVSSLRTRINIRKARGHRDAARVFHAKPKVSATRCGAFTLRLLKFSPGQFNIATAAVPIQCHVRTSRHEPNQRQGEFTGRKTLKRVVSRRRRVIGFSLQHVYPAFPPALLPRLPLQRASSSAPCVRRRVSLGLAWLGLFRIASSDRHGLFPCAETQTTDSQSGGGRGGQPRGRGAPCSSSSAMQRGSAKRTESPRCLVVCRIW